MKFMELVFNHVNWCADVFLDCLGWIFKSKKISWWKKLMLPYCVGVIGNWMLAGVLFNGDNYGNSRQETK